MELRQAHIFSQVERMKFFLPLPTSGWEATLADAVIAQVRNKDEFARCFDTDHKRRASVEKHMAFLNRNNTHWSIAGYCEVCESPSEFLIDWTYSYDSAEGKMPNYRERILCGRCGLNNRQRFMAARVLEFLKSKYENKGSIYLYEQVTPFYKAISAISGHNHVTGSEYLGYDKAPGQIIKGIRHEDAAALSFEDRTFDIVISNDVYEHVPDIATALKETCRVIKDRGVLMFSVPFHSGAVDTRQRATIQGGVLKHLLPEQYHGNPVSSEGSLVFYDFGWDLLDSCRAAGFKDAYMMCYHSFMYGYLGEGLQYMFVAHK